MLLLQLATDLSVGKGSPQATKAILTHVLQLSMFLDIIQMEVRVRTLMSDAAELNMKQC